ncbi:zinc finger, CCHC-type containing protein [Tanacetum coccineum]
MFCPVDTEYWCDPIRRIELASALTVVKIDLTWSIGLVSVELASVEARISLIKSEFSSCLFADSPINLLRVSSIYFLRSCDQASNWLERLPAGSITTLEDLTTRFLAQFFPLGRTAKLRNDILMFQQHHGESLSEAWTRFKDLTQKVPHHGINHWL